MPSLSLFADLSQLAAIRRFVAQAGRDLGLDADPVSDLQLAVDEACTNIVQHAYAGVGGPIAITVERVTESVRVILQDWGKQFDPHAAAVPDVTAPLEQRSVGGMGLFLMREIMDEVTFRFSREEGNLLTMVKRLPRRE